MDEKVMSPAEIDAWADAYIDILQDAGRHRQGTKHPRWWAIERAMFCLHQTDKEELWLFILAVLAKTPPDDVISVLAAGPLEELIGYAGPEVIERVEVESRRNPLFRKLLGGVWRHGESDDVWRRVEAACGERW